MRAFSDVTALNKGAKYVTATDGCETHGMNTAATCCGILQLQLTIGMW